MQTTFNKQAIQASFSKAAMVYDQFADLQRDIGRQLLTLVSKQRNDRRMILDLGCGTGYFSELLASLKVDNQITCFDLSAEMLNKSKQREIKQCTYVQGDIDHNPFQSEQFDLVFSNLVMQWSAELKYALQQIQQTLKPQGAFYFSTLLVGSLHELEQAWLNVDKETHINHFLTKEQVHLAVSAAGFSTFTLFTEKRVKKYKSVLELMQALKGIGANHVHGRNQGGLKGRQLLQKLEQGYNTFRDHAGLYNLTYQVCYVEAYK